MIFQKGMEYREVDDVMRWVDRRALIRKLTQEQMIGFLHQPFFWYKFGLFNMTVPNPVTGKYYVPKLKDWFGKKELMRSHELHRNCGFV